MAEINSADLRPGPTSYQSSRALRDVLIGHDTALPLLEPSSKGDITALRKFLEESSEIALESPHRIYSQDRPAKDSDDVRRVLAMELSNVNTALVRAAENGHAEAVSILVDFASQHGLRRSSVIDRTVVKMAVENGHAAVFDVLATAVPFVVDHGDIHPILIPIDWAIKRSYIELMKVILQRGGGRESVVKGSIPKSFASRRGSRLSDAAKRSKAMTELLIQYGYTVKGSGALQGAAWTGNLDALRFLIEEHGADVNELLPAEDLYPGESLYASWTPMHFAARLAKEDAMKLLESYGAKTDVLDANGNTPLQLMQDWKAKYGTQALIR